MVIDRRTFLKSTAVVATTVGVSGQLAGPAAASSPLIVVSNGTAAAEVVVASDADDQTMHAAQELVRHISEATGAVLPIVTPDQAGSGPRLLVGVIAAGSGVTPSQLSALAPDAFIIRRSGQMCTIVGRDAWGTRYGVYEFLEKYLDIRWLMPDDVVTDIGPVPGADVPERDTLSLRDVDITDAPAFVSRIPNPFPRPYPKYQTWDAIFADVPQAESWGQYARGHHTIEMIHRLWFYVPPEVYGDPDLPTYRPDFYPIHDGQRYIPPPSAKKRWQPRFTADGLATVVANRIIDLQRESPDIRSYSLGVNDSAGFSDDDLDYANPNVFGLPSASEHYYAFVNEVAERVNAVFPDLLFGVLAYREVGDPPSFPVNANVIPYLAHDTFNWLSPQRRARDEAWIARWRAASTRLGWWDYCYGNPYQLPRMYLRHLGQVYTYLHDNDVVGVIAGLRPAWGEGPKPYVISRLFWDPHLNVDRLSLEWCQHAVGRRAAPFLACYYRYWERFWTNRVPQSEWFEASHPVFNQFNAAGYLELVTETDLRLTRRFLQHASDRTQTPAQKARMAALMTYANYYEASAASYPKRTQPPQSESQAMALIDTTVADLDRNIELAKDREALARTLDPKPNLVGPGLVWSGRNLYTAWDLAQYLEQDDPSGPVRAHIEHLIESTTSANVRDYLQQVVALASGRRHSLGQNLSFEQPTPSPWTFDGATSAVISADLARSGTHSLKFPARKNVTATQTVPAHDGFFRLECYIHIPESSGTVTGHFARLNVRFNNSAGRRIQRVMRQFSLQRAIGTWYLLTASELAPAGTTEAVCSVLISSAEPEVYVDDFSIVQIAPPEPEWQTLFADTFDEQSVGSLPTGYTTTTPGAVTVQPATGHGNVLAATGIGTAVTNFQCERDFAPQDGDIRVRFQIRKDAPTRWLLVGLYDQSGARALSMSMQTAPAGQTTGNIRIADDDRGVVSATYTVGTWYDVEMLYKHGTGHYNVWIDGTDYGQFAVAANSGQPTQFRIGNATDLRPNEPYASFDNIIVESASAN